MSLYHPAYIRRQSGRKKPNCRYGGRARVYAVAVLTFKVIQGRWFSSHLKGRVCHFVLTDYSNLGPIFQRFRVMASFSLKNALFLPLLLHLILNLKMFPLHYIAEISHVCRIIHVKSFLLQTNA